MHHTGDQLRGRKQFGKEAGQQYQLIINTTRGISHQGVKLDPVWVRRGGGADFMLYICVKDM